MTPVVILFLQGNEALPQLEPATVVPTTNEVPLQQAAVMTPMDPVKSAADSLLPIVQSQRERFRMRAQELEAVSLARLRLDPSICHL